jgi:dCMP deaminase
MAKEVAKLSYATRLKVGSVIDKNDRLISLGYNGTPKGWDNECETRVWAPKGLLHIDIEYPFVEYSDYGDKTIKGRYKLKTKSEVIHSEANAISKLASSNESGEGSVMMITHAPCMECAKLIYGSGITKVFYEEDYRDRSGIEFLQKCNVAVEKIG